jgi:hypothetical protein
MLAVGTFFVTVLDEKKGEQNKKKKNNLQTSGI